MNDDAVKDKQTTDDIRQDILLYTLERDVEQMRTKLSQLTDRVSDIADDDDLIYEYNVSRIAGWGSFALAGLGTMFFIMAVAILLSAIS